MCVLCLVCRHCIYTYTVIHIYTHTQNILSYIIIYMNISSHTHTHTHTLTPLGISGRSLRAVISAAYLSRSSFRLLSGAPVCVVCVCVCVCIVRQRGIVKYRLIHRYICIQHKHTFTTQTQTHKHRHRHMHSYTHTHAHTHHIDTRQQGLEVSGTRFRNEVGYLCMAVCMFFVFLFVLEVIYNPSNPWLHPAATRPQACSERKREDT